MSYELITRHPESAQRRQDDWSAWNTWSKSNAPWAGAGPQHLAQILVALAKNPLPDSGVDSTLNDGGVLSATQVAALLPAVHSVGPKLTREIVAVFDFAAGHGREVVVQRSGLSSTTALTYLSNYADEL